jgi:hypothetical protein
MNDEAVVALARAVGLPLPAERVAEVASSLEAQIPRGGWTADDLEDIEPAVVFEPRWER